MAVGIYKITNPNGAVYIGSSKNIEQRWNSYKRLVNVSQCKLHNSFLKYGIESHKFEILEICDIQNLLKLEREYSLKFNVLSRENLNLRIPKYLESYTHFSDESKLKMSKAKLGKPSNKKGISLTNEIKLKLSLAKKGKPSKRGTLILNTENGIFYNSICDAANSINMKRSTLSEMLIGRNKNKTNFIYSK